MQGIACQQLHHIGGIKLSLFQGPDQNVTSKLWRLEQTASTENCAVEKKRL